jgi:hypothetical protein
LKSEFDLDARAKTRILGRGWDALGSHAERKVGEEGVMKYRAGLGVFVLALAVASLTLAPSGTATPPFCPAMQTPYTGHPACRIVSVDGDRFQVPLVVGSASVFVFFQGQTSPDLWWSVSLNGEFQFGGWPVSGAGFGVGVPGRWIVQLRSGDITGPVVDTMEVRVRPD